MCVHGVNECVCMCVCWCSCVYTFESEVVCVLGVMCIGAYVCVMSVYRHDVRVCMQCELYACLPHACSAYVASM